MGIIKEENWTGNAEALAKLVKFWLRKKDIGDKSFEPNERLVRDYVAKNMELTEEDTAFINQVFLDRVVNASKKIRGKGLSQEQKREIYTEEYVNAKNKLTDRFGKKMANKVMSLSNKARKEADTK